MAKIIYKMFFIFILIIIFPFGTELFPFWNELFPFLTELLPFWTEPLPFWTGKGIVVGKK